MILFTLNQKISTLPSPSQITLLALVEKYKLEANILPKHKKIFFDNTKLQYQKWSTKELQRWLSTARKIIQRYKLNSKQKVRSKLNSKYTSIIDTNTNLHAPTKKIPHTIIKTKKTNHLKESTITKYYNPTAPTANHTNPTSPIPSKPTNKIASGTLHNNAVPTNNKPISSVLLQDSFHKHNIHHDITSQNPSELRIPTTSIKDSTTETERKKFTKKS